MGEAANTNFIVFGLNSPGLPHSRQALYNLYTIDAVWRQTVIYLQYITQKLKEWATRNPQQTGEIRGSGIVSYSNSMGETVFLDKYWKFSTINTDQDPLKIWNFFLKKAYLNPDRNHKLRYLC